MKKYESYKETGIQWLGRIPNHWNIVPLKFNLSLKGRIGWNGLKSDEFKEESYAYLVTGQDFDKADIDWKKCYQIDKDRYDEDPFIQLSNGDLLITKDGTIGKVAKVSNLDKPACLNSGIFVVKQIKNVYIQDYLYWTFVSNQLLDFNNFNSSGSTIQHLYQNVFENMPLLVPSIAEQEAIASYLDYKVGQIDGVIAEKEKMLKDLKVYRSSIISEAVTKGLDKNVPMKDSGIDCLGSVPKHWRVTRLKFIADNYDGTHFSPETREFGMPYITAGDIRGKGINYDSAKKISQEDYCRLVEQGCKIEKGDVLLVKDGATTGRVGLMTDEMECVALSSVAMLRPHDDIDSLFLMYYMESYSMQTQIVNSMAGSAMPRITLTKLNEFIVNVPPIKEQKVITSFIDNEVEQIDIIIIEIEKEIEDLKSYKSSVITETVTGKVDLREWNKQNVTA